MYIQLIKSFINCRNTPLLFLIKTLIIFLFSKLDTEALYFLFVNVLKY